MTDRLTEGDTERERVGSARANVKARVSKNRAAAIPVDNTTSDKNSDSYTFQLLSFIC